MKEGNTINNYNPFDDILIDERIVVDDKITIKDTIIIKAHLSEANSIICPTCSSHDLIKFGTCSRSIKEKLYDNYKTIVNLKVQKYKCKQCLFVFRDSTTILYNKERISIHVKQTVLEKLREDVTLTHVAKEMNLSPQEVYNVFVSNVNIDRHSLPEVLCIDEFKNLKSANGKYAVVIYDPINHIIIDVLESRLLNDLDDYFYKIPLSEKNSVKYFISDMYEGFRSVLKKHFYNATHVIDTFHYVRYVTGAVHAVRIRVMNSYDEHSKEYRLLKKHWYLIDMPLNKVEEYNRYNPYRKAYTTSSEIIDDCLNLNEELRIAYSLKEDFFLALNSIHYEKANEFLNSYKLLCRESGIQEFLDLANTITDWQKEIVNSFIRFGDKRLNNGYIEGMNNRIKVIKKIGYGYQNFYYFRNRLMYCINENEPLKQTDLKSVPKGIRKHK